MPPRPMNDDEVLSEMNKMVRLRVVSHIYDADAQLLLGRNTNGSNIIARVHRLLSSSRRLWRRHVRSK